MPCQCDAASYKKRPAGTIYLRFIYSLKEITYFSSATNNQNRYS
jgi:hypothetical protein